jgi:hypothetical protein
LTIRIQAYQKHGIETGKIEDEYEFCCWHALYKWLSAYGKKRLHKCPQCKSEPLIEKCPNGFPYTAVKYTRRNTEAKNGTRTKKGKT